MKTSPLGNTVSAILLTVIIGLGLLTAPPLMAADEANLVGTYKCEGSSGGGNTYKGTVEITRKGDTYHLKWSLSANEHYTGIGILQGDVLAVSYYGTMKGVVAYKVDDDKLTGKWTTVDGNGSVNAEVLTR